MCSENEEPDCKLTLTQQLIILFVSLLAIEILAKLDFSYHVYLLPGLACAEGG